MDPLSLKLAGTEVGLASPTRGKLTGAVLTQPQR